MPAIEYSDFDALPDVLATDRFEFLIEPNGQQGANRALAIRCQQIAVPEVMIEPIVVALHGMEFSFRGRRTYDKSMAGAFIETIDGPVTRSIRDYMERVVGSESHNGQRKRQYATVGTLNVYDQSGIIAVAFQIDNLWPNQLPQVQLDGSSAQPYLQNVTFTFDRIRQNGVVIL